MRDIILYTHIILGVLLIVLPIIILLELKIKSSMIKSIALLTAGISWLHLFASGILYVIFYSATKTLIKAGAWPWAHSILMETKEHWGLLLPIIATVAAGLVLTGKTKESKKWWVLVTILTVLIGIMGKVITMGALA
ncbi:MAG: hypothetical protein ACE5KE_02090 [Methanosarcinales archaeon]